MLAFEFATKVDLIDYGRMVYWVLRLPKALQNQAPFKDRKRVRMEGEISGVPVRLAWVVDAKGHYLMLGRSTAKRAGLGVGSTARVRFKLVGDDAVEVPAEIREALRQEPSWRAPWRALTPGMQRSLSYLVLRMRTEEKRAQRAVEVLEHVAAGTATQLVRRPPRSKL
jgi:hypothetical protein